MPAWVVPAIMGVLSAAGTILTNRSNAKQARENREFQERMSNTAAQRSRADFEAAGLNPALAYERTASSPTGSSAVMGDVLGSGVASARAAQAIQQEMRIAREQHVENLRLTRAQTQKTAVEGRTAELLGDNYILENRLKKQLYDMNDATQPYQKRLAAAEAMLRELEIPGARNTAAFEELIGRGRPGIATARSAAEILKILNPRGFRR